MGAIRQWLGRGLRGLTDSALGYGLGLAVLWAPVVLLAQMQIGGLRDDGRLGLRAVVTSIIGMLVGGVIVYHVTRKISGASRPRERAVILAVTVPFAALVIAAAQHVVYHPLLIFVMLFYGIVYLHWAILLTAVWTGIYLALPAPGRISIYARQPVSDDRARTTYWVGFFVVVIAVLAAYLNLIVLVIEEMGRVP